MIVAFRHLLRHRGDVRRATVDVSDTGATKFTYNSAVPATLLIDPSSDPDLNDKVQVTAREPGAAGNAIAIEYVVPGATSQLMSVVIDPGTLAHTVGLATDAVGAVSSSAADVVAAINAVSSVLEAALPLGSTGADEVAAFGLTSLAGGDDDTNALYTDVACLIQGGRGRLRQLEQGQVGGRSYTLLFGPEVEGLQQNDILVVTYPVALGTFRLVHVNRVFTYGVTHLQCDAEQYIPAGGD